MKNTCRSFALLLLAVGTCFAAYPTYPIGLGASTVTCLDKDGDGYGVGPGCTGPDVDDNDREIHTTAQALNKYGSSLTYFLNHLGYFPTRQWFIATTGNDGTCAVNNAALPCLTWAHVNASLAAGDAVLWRAGTYAAITLPSATGTSSAPIILMAYPGESVTIQPTTDINAINLGWTTAPDESWFIIDGFTLNVTTASSSGGIQGGTFFGSPAGGVIHSANVTIRNVDVKNTFYWGLIAQNTTSWTVENNVFEGTRAASGEHNIYMGSNKETTNFTTGLTIQRNIIYNSSVNGNEGNGIQTNCGNVCTGTVIQQNLIYNNALSGISWESGNQNSFIRDNVIFGNGRQGIIITNYDGDCLTGTPLICPNDQTGNLIENNTIWTSGFDRTGTAISQPGILVGNTSTGFVGNLGGNTYRNNIITSVGGGINNDYPPVAFSNASGGTTQSTAYLSTSVFSNNIFWPLDGGTGVIALNAGVSFGYQAYTCAGVASKTTISSCINSNPSFTSSNNTAWYALPANFDFTPSGGSPAIAAGNATLTSPRDAKAIRHPATPAIGGLEPVSGTAVTTGLWTHFQTHGIPVQDAGYTTMRYAAAVHSTCGEHLYHEGWTEYEKGMLCWSWDENFWSAMDLGSFFANDTMPDAGHTVGRMVYVPRLGSMIDEYAASGTNQPDVSLRSYLFDFNGLAGRPVYTRNSSSGDVNRGILWGTNIEPIQPMSFDVKNDVIAACCDDNGFTWHATAGSNVLWTRQTTTGTTPAAWFAEAYNSTDGLVYTFGGANTNLATCSGTAAFSDIHTYNTQTLTWSLLTTQGATLQANFRGAAAYSPKDNGFLILVGMVNPPGCTTGPPQPKDQTFWLDMTTTPPTLTDITSAAGASGIGISGCPSTTPCGSGAYWMLAYDSDHNGFIYNVQYGTGNEYLDGAGSAASSESAIYVYCRSACTPVGQSAVTFNTVYTPASGGFNRYGPGHTHASQSISNAMTPAIASSGSTLYGVHTESSGTFYDATMSNGNYDQLYGWQWTSGGGQAFLPAATDYTAIDPDAQCSGVEVETGDASIAILSGNPWISYWKTCVGGGNTANNWWYTRVAKYSSGTWSSGQIPIRNGDGTPGHFSGAQSKIVVIGTTAYIVHRQIDRRLSYTSIANCYLESTTDASTFTAVGPVLTVNSGGNNPSCDGATDGTNIWIATTELVSSSQFVGGQLTTTPQVYVWKCTTAGSCTQQGGSLNITGSDYSSFATVAWMNGKPYVCWLERAIGGTDQLYCAVSNTGGSTWTTINSGSPISRGGWAYRPQIAVDATNNILYAVWPEQPSLGNPIQIFAASSLGSTFTQLAGAANVTGSAHAVTATVLGTNLVTAFQQQLYGTVPQIYSRQWSGSTWTALGASGGSAGGSATSGSIVMSGNSARQ